MIISCGLLVNIDYRYRRNDFTALLLFYFKIFLKVFREKKTIFLILDVSIFILVFLSRLYICPKGFSLTMKYEWLQGGTELLVNLITNGCPLLQTDDFLRDISDSR